MKNFRGSALAAGVGTPESAPHELPRSSLHFYLVFKHRDYFESGPTKVAFKIFVIFAVRKPKDGLRGKKFFESAGRNIMMMDFGQIWAENKP